MPTSSATDDAADAVPAYVTFEIAAQLYALPVTLVRRILDAPKVSPLPGADHGVLGVIDVSGETAPILDLAGRLGAGFDAIGPGDDARALVLERGADDPCVAVIVDRVLDVREIADADTEPAPREAARAGLVRRVARVNGAFAFVLDPATAVFGAAP